VKTVETQGGDVVLFKREYIEYCADAALSDPNLTIGYYRFQRNRTLERVKTGIEGK